MNIFEKFLNPHSNDHSVRFGQTKETEGERPVLSKEQKAIYKIVIENGDGVIFSQEYTSQNHEEFDELLDACKIEKESYTPLESMLVTTRVNTISNFAKDFFVPTTANYISNIDNVALKSIAGIFSVILDILTLPIRVVTLPFRAIVIKVNKHPLQEILDKNLTSDSDELYVKAYEIKKIRNNTINEKMACGYVHLVDVPKSETSHLFYGSPTKSSRAHGMYNKTTSFSDYYDQREYQSRLVQELEEEKEKYKNALGLFGLNEDYTSKELSSAFRKKSLPIHPDRSVNKSEEVKKVNEGLMKDLTEAYALLKEYKNF